MCGFWRSPKWVGLSIAAIGLQATGISYCYEHMTDGRLPGDPEDVATVLGLKYSLARRPMGELFERGIWAQHTDSIEIVDYAEHNPLRAEVRTYRQSRATASAKANHARWHEGQGTSDPDCPFCSVTESDSESDTDGAENPNRNGPRTPHMESHVSNVRNGSNGEEEKPSRRKRRATALPDDWKPSDDQKSWLANNFPNVNGKLETEKFRDHAKGVGRAQKDWDAAWRNWMRNAGTKYAPPGQEQQEPQELCPHGTPVNSQFPCLACKRDREAGDAS